MKPPRCAVGTIALFAFLSLVPTASALPGDTVRLSIDEFGVAGNGPSSEPAVSADGRFVAFQSGASNLVPGDTNARSDVFVHDRATGSIERVSVPETGAGEVGPGETEQADGSSLEASISADGRFVAFASAATNLVPGDTNNHNDVFVHDRLTDTIERVSVGEGGSQSTVHSGEPAISADGLHVAFRSGSALLPAGNTLIDVFVHDRVGGLTERVSVNDAGEGANGSSLEPSISSDGSLVAFQSPASNLTSGGAPGADVFVRDREAGATELVSAAVGGGEGNGTSAVPRISADGSTVAFASQASDLVPGDVNASSDYFAFDRSTQTAERVNIDRFGAVAAGFFSLNRPPAISADGRYVAFGFSGFDMIPGRTIGEQIYVRDRLGASTEIASVSSGGLLEGIGTKGEPTISGDGSAVVFDMTDGALVPGDENGFKDVFAHERGGEPAPAPEVVTLDAATGGATDITQSAGQAGPTDLHSTLNASWDSFLPGLHEPGLEPWLTGSTIHYDDDFTIDATGLPSCDPASLFGTSTAAAIAACPGAVVGSGNFEAALGSGVLTLFNGLPAGANPTLVVHIRVVTPFGEGTEIRGGVFRPSSLGGEFGTELAIDAVAIGLSQLDLTLLGEPAPGHVYVGARCADADRLWDLASTMTFDYGIYAVAQQLSTELTQECTVDGVDSDGDGIDDSVDQDPESTSGAFSDGEGTAGTIVNSGGLDVTVTDAPAPDGVRIATGPGSGEAQFSVCGFKLTLAPESEAVGTCGSLTVQVVHGEAEVSLGDGSVVVSVPAGGTAKVTDEGEGSYSVENLGETGVLVSVDGVEQTVGPGESTEVSEGPAAIALSPLDAVNVVSTTHDVAATVENASGGHVPDVTVRYAIAGSIAASGTCATGAQGTCEFSYDGPDFPGADRIDAYADSNGNGIHDPGEPIAVTATKAWLEPATTPGQVTGGGQVPDEDGDKVAFGFTAKSDAGGLKGNCNLVDPATKTELECTSVSSISVAGSEATIFGQATLDGEPTTYRIDVDDRGEPGKGTDGFTIRTADGYRVGGTLKAGNVQVG